MHLLSFAHTGAPGRHGNFTWQAYSHPSNITAVLDMPLQSFDWRQAKCDLWNVLPDIYPGAFQDLIKEIKKIIHI